MIFFKKKSSPKDPSNLPKGNLWRRLRLSTRLTLLVFCVEFIVLTAFALTNYFFSLKQFYNSFDLSLRTQAEALISMIDMKNSPNVTKESLKDLSQYLSHKRHKDLFAIIGPKGEEVYKSDNLDDLPKLAKQQKDKIVSANFHYEGRHYRGICFPSKSDKKVAPWFRTQDLYIFLATGSRKMEKDLVDIAQFLVWSACGLLLVSVPLAGIIARRGFAPIRKLARETDKIEETRLHLRLADDSLPPDLAPMARAMNALLERLEIAFERQKQFSADAAHELRTPVAILKSGVQAALLSKRDNIEDQAALENLLDEVSRLENLCESLLLISSAQETTDHPSLLTLEEWMECVLEVIEDLGALAAEHSCAIQFNPPPVENPIMLATDEQATRRIVTNLLQNAIRHGGGTAINTTLTLEHDFLILAVEDDGVGVPEGDEGKLFDRFFRADSARSRDSGGAGLGLAICRALAESSGGSLSYERRSPHGSRFLWRVMIITGKA